VDISKMDIRGIGLGGTDCNDLAQERNQSRALVNMIMVFQRYWVFGLYPSSKY
jgi:hypothetical protein